MHFKVVAVGDSIWPIGADGVEALEDSTQLCLPRLGHDTNAGILQKLGSVYHPSSAMFASMDATDPHELMRKMHNGRSDITKVIVRSGFTK